MKTYKSRNILMWYRLLPEDIRLKAVANIYNENIHNWSSTKKQKASNISDSIVLGFCWQEAPEQNDYWLNIYENLYKLHKKGYDMKLLKYVTNLPESFPNKAFIPIYSDKCPYKIKDYEKERTMV